MMEDLVPPSITVAVGPVPRCRFGVVIVPPRRRRIGVAINARSVVVVVIRPVVVAVTPNGGAGLAGNQQRRRKSACEYEHLTHSDLHVLRCVVSAWWTCEANRGVSLRFPSCDILMPK
jgi:hypothetical protein